MKMNQPTSGRLITFWATAILCISFSFAFGAKIVPVNVKKAVLYKTTPQRDLHLDIHYPETDLKGEYPVVIYTEEDGPLVTSQVPGSTKRVKLTKV